MRDPVRSRELFARARARIPGGVSSPARACRAVGDDPLYMARGEGGRMWDEDGNGFVDFCLAWGPLILGHAHPAVVEAVNAAVRDGLAFGTCHRLEPALAERVLAAFPHHERVRFVVSGTEAVATALRIARAARGRRRVLKFTGCYHGHVDALMVRAGSGLATAGLADSAGVTAGGDTIVAPLDSIDALDAAFAAYGNDIAAAIVEPVPANNGLLPQTAAWHRALRERTAAHGTLLIYDEVITGFRFGFCGADRLLGVEPDLTTLGKIVGGGLPVAAVAGRATLLDRLAPEGPVYQAGTMAGNPVCLAAGAATLDVLAGGEPYRALAALQTAFDDAFAAARAADTRAPNDHTVRRVVREGPVFWPYPGDGDPPRSAEAIDPHIGPRFAPLRRTCLEQGLYLPPSAYEVGFFSAAHTKNDVTALARALARGPATI